MVTRTHSPSRARMSSCSKWALFALAAVSMGLVGCGKTKTDTATSKSDPALNGGSDSRKSPWVSSFDASTVSVGFWHMCAVGTDSTPYCWFRVKNDMKEATIPSDLGPVTDIAAGNQHTCAIQKSTDAVICWGDNAAGKNDVPSSVGAASVVRVGREASCAIRKSDRNVICWGTGASASVPAGLGAVKDLSMSQDGHACAVQDPSGKAVCWGSFTDAQIPSNDPNLAQVVLISANTKTTWVKSSINNKMYVFGSSLSSSTSGVFDVSAAAMGGNTDKMACHVTSGKVSCFGMAGSGREADLTSTAVPSELGTPSQLSFGPQYVCGISKGTNRVSCWDDNGQSNFKLP